MTSLETLKGKRIPVRFLLSMNRAGSATRFTADTASALAKMGIPVTVEYPAVDWWDYQRFTLSRLPFLKKWKWTVRLAGQLLWGVLFHRRWCGFRYHRVDPRVKTHCYGLAPTARHWKPREITVVHPPYLIPHLLRTLPQPGLKMVSALHMNLEKALASPSAEAAAWYRNWVARERYLQIPRYTTSQASREAAQRLGIPVRRIIYDGSLDLDLFHPDPTAKERKKVAVLLYCDRNLQKGQAVGIRALEGLKASFPQVQFYSVGNVYPRYANFFDQNHGFLHQEQLVKVLQETDIFVYPSLYDGFPAPPLQALACGAALVSTAVEGVREYVVPGENGLLCEPGDPISLRNQVIRLIQDSDLRRKLQQNGPQTAQAFSIEKSTEQLLEFLEEVYAESPVEAPTLMEVSS